MIQVVDLFSCVGAHHLGWEMASELAKRSAEQPSPEDRRLTFDPEYLTMVHCESRPYRRAVLAQRYPLVPVWPDVTTLRTSYFEGLICEDDPVAVVGGPPCQNTSPLSSISGNRTHESLVSYQIRLAAGLQADWCVVEQPTDTPVWEDRAVAALAERGYHVGRLEFSASDLGAPYQRRRVYLLACAQRRGLEIAVDFAPSALEAVRAAAPLQDSGRGWDPDYLGGVRVDLERSVRLDEGSGRVVVRRDRGSDRRDRIEALGDSNPPEMMAVVALCLMRAHG